MAKQTELFLTRSYNHSAVVFASTDTGFKTLYTAGADDSRIISIFVTSTDTTPNDLFYYLYNGTTDFLIGHADIPIAAGTDGATKHVNGLDTATMPGLIIDSNGNAFIPLKAGWSLRGKTRAAVGAAKEIVVATTAEDY